MLKRLFFATLLPMLTLSALAQGNSKLSAHLQQMSRRQRVSTEIKKSHEKKILTLMTVTGENALRTLSADYGLEVQDSIGRIYIVRIPLAALPQLSSDARVERIEAEPVAMNPATRHSSPARSLVFARNPAQASGSLV